MTIEQLPIDQLQAIDTKAVNDAIKQQELSKLQPVDTKAVGDQISR